MEWPQEEGENDDQGHPAQSVMDGTRSADGGLSPRDKDTQKSECWGMFPAGRSFFKVLF